VPYRSDEKFWLIGGAPGEVTICYGINFEGAENQSLAHVMLHEYQIAMRKTQAPCHVKYFDKELPETLAAAFPDIKLDAYSNGIMTFSKYSESSF